jgi:hypothetical protein
LLLEALREQQVKHLLPESLLEAVVAVAQEGRQFVIILRHHYPAHNPILLAQRLLHLLLALPQQQLFPLLVALRLQLLVEALAAQGQMEI